MGNRSARAPVDIAALIEDLVHTATVASLNFDIWWLLKSDESRPKHVETMNSYANYFNAAIHAHFVAMVTALYRMYETRNDTHNIFLLIRRLREEGLLAKRMEQRMGAKLDELKPTWIKVSIIRNGVFGHSSASGSAVDAFSRAGISANEIRGLIDGTKSMLNSVTSEIYNRSHACNLEAASDGLRLLEDLSRLRGRQ